MNDKDTALFAKLKYSVTDIFDDTQISPLPDEVKIKWAWRCVDDVEQYATTPESKKVFDLAQKYRDGSGGDAELDDALQDCLAGRGTTEAACAAYYAARAYDAYNAAVMAVYSATGAAAYAAYCASNTQTPLLKAIYEAIFKPFSASEVRTKFSDLSEQTKQKYTDWLWEELINYEEQQ